MAPDHQKTFNVPVNWENLTAALCHYKTAGFTQVHAPWVIPPEYMKVTFPERDAVFDQHNGGYQTCYGDLIGSAEQSLLYMLMTGQLAHGAYVSLTPCFRIEPEYDRLHSPYFAKVELFSTREAHVTDLKGWTERALVYFQKLAKPNIAFEIVETDIGYDIEANGVEVGSYNRISVQGHTWVCGTGLAEPRFSQVCL